MKREKLAVPAVLLFAMLGTSATHATVILSDDFESYADTAAMQAAWGATGLGTLATMGNPGKSMSHPGGTDNTRLFAPTTPTDSVPLIWEFDFYDDGNSNKRLTGGLRDDGGGGSLNALLEMGRYNFLYDPESNTNVDGYGVRTVFVGSSPANWVTFVGKPKFVQGWHHFIATIGASSILFELDLQSDGSVDATRSVSMSDGAGIAYDIARLGGPSNVSSAGGGAYFDNFRITLRTESVPEPGALALLAIGFVGLYASRRRMR